MAQQVVIAGAMFNDVPSISVPDSNSVYHPFVDPSVTTAAASDVAQGKQFIAADGTLTQGTASGGGTVTLKMGVLRPDAELVQKWTYDKYIVQDEGATLPSYTTSVKTLKASALLSNSMSTDFTSYCYMIVTRGLAIPVYSINTIDKGREEYAIYSRVDEMILPFIRLGNTNASVNPLNSQPSYMNRIAYWNSSNDLRSVNSTSGINFSNPTNTSYGGGYSGNLSIYSPSLRLQGSSSYLTNTYFNSLTDIRYQYVVELYREPLNSLNIDGFNHISQTTHIVDCMNTSGSTLT